MTAKTKPLSEHARTELRHIKTNPVPRNSVNPGVVGRLLRDSLVESVMMPSPFPAHKGRHIEHLKITDAGLSAVTHN